MNKTIILTCALLASATSPCFSATAAQPNVSAEATFSYLDDTHARLLLSDRADDVLLAAKSISQLGAKGGNILDLAAEVFAESCSHADQKAVSWLAVTLADSGNGRYRGVLTHCLNGADEEAKGYIKEALKKLPNSSSSQFEMGQVSLADVAQGLRLRAASFPSKAEAILDLKAGDTLPSVYRRVGYPSKVESVSVRGRNHGFALIKIKSEYQMLLLTYDDLGAVEFDLVEGTHKWAVDTANYKGSQTANPDSLLRFQIAAGDKDSLRLAVASLKERALPNGADPRSQWKLDRDLLDQVAQRISDTRFTPDHFLGGALADLCKVVMRTNDGRYKAVMADVSATATSAPLRKMSKQAAGALPEVATAESFTPVARPTVSEPDVVSTANAPEAKSTVLAPRPATNIPTVPPGHSADAEARLKKLGDLRKKGLITQGEYEEKRREILEQL